MDIRSIGDVMVRSPHTIGKDIKIAKAREIMAEHSVRHLPVLEAGRVVGILSHRDLMLAGAVSEKSEDLVVEDFMIDPPYTVREDEPLFRVALAMAEQKYGSAIVVDDLQKPVGIFTAVDGLNLLATLLQRSGG